MPPLSINYLTRVSGVGPSTIQAFRDAGFNTFKDLEGKSLEDLTQVPGVGEATAQAILEYLASPAAKDPVQDYRYSETRKNIPPAGLAAHGKVEDAPSTRYFYDPHLPPVLRFDDTGQADQLPELLQEARQRPLTEAEARLLSEALQNHQPWLEWTGKREKRWFDVDPIALHIHERVSAQAIMKLAARQPIQRDMFADPELEYRQAVQFYQHDIDWTNRLILGDSLTVMHSLANREDLAGKVQMIYVDPPYGIKYSSNFQPRVGKKDVKDKESDLTREPEQIKAYRDTWSVGTHTYLSYLRDRFKIARDLLSDTGSIFVQISEENVHRVRDLLDEIFLPENFISEIIFTKTTGLGQELLDNVNDFVLWYSKNHKLINETYNQIFLKKVPGNVGASRYQHKDVNTGELFTDTDLRSQSGGDTITYLYRYQNKEFSPNPTYWKTTTEGMKRLESSHRLMIQGATLRYKRFLSDFPVTPLVNVWTDVGGIQSRSDPKIYVVQTTNKVIERCMLMTTKPGDLVLDPTCGSGTTAFVAEQWGRRWITIDTSRVAVALARQRLLTAKFDYYDLVDPNTGPLAGFHYKTVPHITLKSIAQNQALDPIFAKWEPILDEKLAALNAALSSVTPAIRARLLQKLADKQRREGKRAITDADQRRWQLPQNKWEHWEVPYDTDPEWPPQLNHALKEYRKVWRSKMDEVNAVIAASAPQEVLVDQPEAVPGVLRVSGPFTVEGVQPLEEQLAIESPIGGEPEALDTFEQAAGEPANAEAYLEKMIRLLRTNGVRFPDNKVQIFERLDPIHHTILHAAGEWQTGNGSVLKTHNVAVFFGPQYGSITAQMVEEALRAAYRGGYDDLVFAGFSIDGAAQAIIQDDPNPQVRAHLVHISPDVNMGDLLKDTRSNQLFTVFGLPRIELIAHHNAMGKPTGEWIVEMQGVDIYDPVENTIQPTRADKVAAWFLDSDYDGSTFCISQAFFPDSTAWDKLAKALKTTVDPQRFAAFSGTLSLPFSPGSHRRIAVKVIDPRGNEVMSVKSLMGEERYA